MIIWSYSLEYGGIEAVLDEFVPRTLGSRGGAGHELMQHVTQAARDAGAVVLRLETERDNDHARVFYTQLGFETSDHVLLMLAL